ncbi:S16 family serine protease [Shewanella waksmanii]|uniref:S16 family serine protease n=1 Tax=Shewanella waksmanii TaxID=213783 RepID=UPI0037371140
MNLKPLLAKQLSPLHQITSINELEINPTSALVGQNRLLSAFQLFQKSNCQQLYIADQSGIHRQGIINGLHHIHVNTNDTETSQEGPIYLHGSIKRQQLLGHIDSQQQYQSGVLDHPGIVYICAESLWKREALWELLFQILEDQHYQVTSQGAPRPLRCKIVLIGPSQLYSLAFMEERLFQQHFALLGEMVNEVAISSLQPDIDPSASLSCDLAQYCQWLRYIAKSADLELSIEAIKRLLTFSSKQAEHQQHLTLLTVPISQLLHQASIHSDSPLITATAIDTALNAIEFRHNASKQLSAQNFDEKFISLLTEGAVVGQINGLTVIDMAEYSYGEPARITASVHYGDGEVADIERKSELAGNIHAKGMMILSSCLYRIFGKDAPLHLNANIVFEQSYQEIDGDSASLAEYCALISAITDKAIDQGIAATGAIDQFGNIQAIGGVNEKIEGFFDLCKRRGLTGQQGVIIPVANVQQLNLKPEVIDAVSNNQFHIYEVAHIDQAVERLINIEAGQCDENNQFPDDTLYGLVQSRLEALAGYQEDEPSFFERLLDKLKISS